MLITILAAVFILSVVIVVHEFGHFIVAKKLGIFVKVFSIGFGRKVLKKRVGETVYAISALPFGGYVKFAGESEDGESKEAPRGDDSGEVPENEIDPSRYFVNKRPLVRSAVVFAGPFSNYVLAVLIYTVVLAFHGVRVAPETTVVGRVEAGSPADSAGFRANDKLLGVDGRPVSNWDEVVNAIWERRDTVMTVEFLRGGDTLSVDFRGEAVGNRVRIGLAEHVSTVVGQVKRDGPAYKAGIRPGAVIEAINDTLVTSFYDIERITSASPDVPLIVRWSKDGVQREDTITPVRKKALKEGTKTEYEIRGQMGVGVFYEYRRVSPPRAFVMAVDTSANMVLQILSFLKEYFTGRARLDSIGGPILITQMAGEMARWGFDYLVYFLAFFSINLCIFNLLPVLPFDGGHLVLFLYEGIARRRVNRRLRELLTQAGFVLLIALMVFVVVLDLSRCAGSSPSLF
jgi:regulator of sigma E protease